MSTINNAPTFAPPTGGWLQVSLDNNDTAKKLLLQPDGKIIVTGDARSFYAALRLNTDGSVDQTFGNAGKVVVTGLTIPFGQSYGAAFTSDGSLIIGGNSNQSGQGNLMAVRLTPNGQLDTSFGNAGQADMTTPANEQGLGGVVVQASGKVLIGGYTQIGFNNQPFTLGRLNADGSVDTSFGTNGLLQLPGVNGTTGFFSEDAAGNLLIVGKSAYASSSSAIIRLTADGQMDTSFGSGGRAIVELGPQSENANNVIVQADGKILVIGDTGLQDMAVARLNTDGTPDLTFGTSGRAIIDIGTSNEPAMSAAVQADGKIVLVGSSYNVVNGNVNFNLVATRLNADGTLDTTFANAGKFIMNQGGLAIARDVAIQPDGKIVIAGYGRDMSAMHNDFIVVRLHADGTLDNSFNTSAAAGINTLDGVASYTEGQPGVVLDSDVSIYDAELAAQGHYGGARITMSRQNDAEDEDVFGATGNVSFDTVSGNVSVSGVVIGTVSQANGVLAIEFNDQATQIRVDETLRSITYKNTSSTPPASVTIVWLFDDGNVDDSQGQGGRQSAFGTTVVNITDVQSPPTLGGIEPIGGETEDVLVTMDLALLKAMGDAADTDGTVTAFRVTEVVSGSLRLGADEATAQAWQAGVNDTVDANTKAFWQPPENEHGNVTGFRVVAIDNEGLESTTPVAVRVELESVPDRPTLANGAELVAIDEDVPSADVEDPSSNPPNWGDDINELISASGYADGDGDGIRGIAIAGDASDPLTQGRWQYSNDVDGALWRDIGPVSPGAALLLSDGSLTGLNATYLRFVPVADYHGQPGALTVHVVDSSDALLGFTTWDGATETRHTIDISASTAIAATGVEWNVTVKAVADAPVISHLGADDNQTVPLPTTGVLVDIGTAVTVTDVDTDLITAGSLRVSFSSPHNAGDSLTLQDPDNVITLNNITVSIADRPIGTLIGVGGGPNGLLEIALTNATMADVALLLQHLQFATTSTVSGARVIQITVNDGEAETTTEVTITALPLPKVDVELSADSFKAGDTLTVTFTLTDASADFTADDVTLNGGTLDDFAVDANNPLVYTATITPTADSDNLVVSVSVAAGVFTNAHGMANQASGNDTFAIGDTRAPEFDAVALPKNVASAITSADTIAFRVIFSEDVTGLDADDFVVTGGTTATVTNVASVDGTAWIITVSGGDLASFNGNVGLALASDATVTDDAGNVLTDLVPETSIEYTLDNVAPVIASIARDDVTQPTSDLALEITLTLTETGSGVDAGSLDVTDISVSGPNGITLTVTDVDYDAVTGIATYTVSPPNGGWNIALHAGEYTVAVNADAILDKAGLAVAANSAAHTFNVRALPKVEVELSATTFKADETLTVTFTLTDETADFTADDVTVEGGVLSDFVIDPVNPLVYTATLTPTAGQNAVAVSVSVAADRFENADGYGNTASTAATATGDTQPPALDTIAPVGDSVTHADTLTFRAVFNEDMLNVDAADFIVTGASGVSIDQVVRIEGDTYEITVSGGNLASFNGAVGLALAAGNDITDEAGNALSALTAGSNTGFTLDNTPPVLVDVEQDEVTHPAADQQLQIKLSFTETGSGLDADSFDATDISVSGPNGITLAVTDVDYDAATGIATYTVSPPSGGWDIAVHAGEYTVAVNADAILDKVGLAVAADSAAHTFNVRPLPKVEVELSATTFKAGDALTVTFTLTDETTDFTADDVTVEGGTLTGFAVDVSNPLVYTATLTPTAGQNHVPVSVAVAADRFENVDGYGNAASTAATATGDTLAPTLSTIAIVGSADATYTSEDALTFRVTFDEDVYGVGIDDFQVTGTSGAVVTGVTTISHDVYEITIGGAGLVDFNGDVGLALASDADIADAAGNGLGSLVAGSSTGYVVDNTPPVLADVVQDEVTNPAADQQLQIKLSFTETGSGIDADSFDITDISVSGPNGITLSVSDVDYDAATGIATYTVQPPVGGWDMDLHAGEYTVAVNPGAILDKAGLAVAADSAAHTFNVRPLPKVEVELSATTFKAGDALTVTFTLTDETTGFTADDVTVEGGTLTGFAIDASNPLVYTATLTPTAGQNHVPVSVSVAADRFENVDGYGNAASTAATATGDTLAPTLSSIALAGGTDATYTSEDALTFRVTFDEDVYGVGVDDFQVTGTSGAVVTGVTLVSHDIYEVTIGGAGLVDFNGDVGLALAADASITDGAGNAIGSLDAGSSQGYVLDNTAPVLLSIERGDLMQPSGDETLTIQVTLIEAGSGIDADSISALDISVTGPGGVTLTVTAADYDAGTGVATYTLAAPAGGWDLSVHAGQYTVALSDNEVFDRAGLALAGNAVAHTFDVIANLNPVITSNAGGATASINHAEGVLTVTTVTATDADGDALSYAIVGGADAARFTLDPTTGALVFTDALYSNAPLDADADGIYEVIVEASDGRGGKSTQALSVSVLSDIDGDGIPDIEDTDADGDGLPDDLESAVPDLLGDGHGDGNGDGIDDGAQLNVASLPTLGSSAGTPEPWATIAVAQGLSLVNVTNSAAPSGLPRSVKMPAGQFGFTIEGLEVGGSTEVSFYIDASLRVNTYYKQNHVTGAWTNIAAATAIPGSDKVKLTFTLTDGGIFDADGVANGVIVDPGGAAILGPRIISHGGDVLASVQVQENARLVGTVKAELPPGQTALNYAITGGADAMRFTIDAATGVLRFVDAPDFERPVDEGADNVYDVQVTVRDQNEQSDTQLLSVQVLDVDETVPVDPDPVDSDDDGLPDSMENGVPGMVGGVRGDGNGDGIPDVEQSDVTSLTWQGTVGGQTRYVTLTNDAGLVQTSVSTATLDPARVPEKLSLPLGALAFTVTDVPDSGVVGFSIYVDADVPVNGYWKEVDGQWFNLATAITEVGGKTRIDFSIEDGGRFDADGERNGVIVDPGAPGWFDGNPYDTDGDWVPDLLEAGLGLTVGVKDNDVFERDDLFVMQLYRDALGREADAGGLAYWQGQLTADLASKADVVLAVLGSAEAQDLAVLTQLSLSVRDTVADTTARDAWRDALDAGETAAELADAFLATAYGELASGDLVDRLYTDLLGRPADAGGKAYWAGQIDAGVSAGEVARHMMHGGEFDALHGDTVFAAELYTGLLGRTADAPGLAYWADTLQQGMVKAELIGAVTASTEYHDRFLPASDADLLG